jgi:predicted CXXCH cytochrome family protein
MIVQRAKPWLLTVAMNTLLVLWIAWAAAEVETDSQIAPAATETAPARNPHWQKDGCADCHTMAGGKPLPIADAQATAVCIRCHDGEHARGEVHPIGRKPDPAKFADPGWPLANGTVACITCHDMRPACSVTAQKGEEETLFLRGVKEEQDIANVCANCHRPERMPKYNPHVMLAADGQAQTDHCLTCHDKPMDRTTMKRSGNPSLRVDQVTLCRSCHPHHHDISPKGHVGTTIKPEMLAYIRGREISGLLTPPSKHLLDELAAAKAAPSFMVPDHDGRVVCSTCHNPHQRGLFPLGSQLGYREMTVSNGKAYSPVRGEQFCMHCHSGF